MDIKIEKAILHVLSGNTSVFSQSELDVDSEVCYGFITRHVKRLLNNASAREACFTAQSFVYSIVSQIKEDTISFKEGSTKICEHLHSLMEQNDTISAADVLITIFEIKNNKYMAILKLNYKECFTHKISVDEGGITENEITLFNGALDGSKVTDACLIPYDPMILKIIEKPCTIGQDVVNYFSEMFLECDAELSKKETCEIICELADEMSEKYYQGDVEKVAQLKNALNQYAKEQEGIVDVISVAKNVFADNEEACEEYVSKVKEEGVKPDVELGERVANTHFGVQRIKSENGIELKFPTELCGDSDFIEFVKEENGTTTIMLKNWTQNS